MAALREIGRRILMLLRRASFDRDLEEEMQLHLDLRRQALRDDGRSDADARIAANRRFGNRIHLREQAADAWGWTWLEDLARDTRYGMRQLIRAPKFTATAMSILAVGAGVSLAFLHLANAANFYLVSVPDAGALVRLSDGPQTISSYFPFAAASFYREHNTVFDYLVSENRGVRVSLDEDPAPLAAAFVSGNYFRDLKVIPALGRLLEERDANPAAAPAVVLGHRYWQREFGLDASVVDRVLRVNSTQVQVVGVAPSNFDGLAPPGTANVAVWFPMSSRPRIVEDSSPLDDVTRPDTAIFGTLKPGVSGAVADAQLRTLTAELQREHGGRVAARETTRVIPLTRARFEADIALIFLLVFLIFLSACANLGSMLLARGLVRSREVEMRLALGASQWRVARQLMTENLILAILGCVAGTAAGYVSARVALRFITDLPPGVHVVLDWRMLAASAAMICLAVCGFGLTPAIRAVRQRRTSTKARQTLVAVQVAASCVLLILAALLARGGERLRAIEPAFDYRQTIVVDPQFAARTLTLPRQRAVFDDLTGRLERVSGVDGVTAATRGVEVQAPGRPSLLWYEVSPSYFDVLNLPVVRGRTFLSDEKNAIVISESAARVLWLNQDALGQMFHGQLGDLVVVGIVKDSGLQRRGPSGGAGEAYMPLTDRSLSRTTVLVHTNQNPRALLRPSAQAVAASGLTPTVAMMETVLNLRESNGAGFVGILGSLATMLAFIGIFGLVAFAVAQRTREIGVRLALGARRTDILRTLIAQHVMPLAAGGAAGLALAMAGAQVVRNQLYGLTPLDPISFATGIGSFVVIALLAILLPARKALRMEAASALRWE